MAVLSSEWSEMICVYLHGIIFMKPVPSIKWHLAHLNNTDRPLCCVFFFSGFDETRHCFYEDFWFFLFCNKLGKHKNIQQSLFLSLSHSLSLSLFLTHLSLCLSLNFSYSTSLSHFLCLCLSISLTLVFFLSYSAYLTLNLCLPSFDSISLAL